ncbi:succinic semialdehyde dehydrogenase [Corynebacterium kozikiae]|uniref:succinic semialdehyde dehydrogenase n=1 Tax=Corynebacterium kozikiae TaxID=2968469 RepID=UPI00211C334F|nr:succinic semialdehyde dehydrogenase [Corynebacterium sp. 76QC2CO]MCQ9342196.1 succinic semialdehyde dehydrogenase [Corynebacterium sp. 76QC2CO]
MSSAEIIITNPRTGEVLATVPSMGISDVDVAFSRARAAAKRWAQTNVRERAAVFLRLHDLLLEHRDELLETIVLETGKNRASAFEEVMDTVINARYYGKKGPSLLKPRRAKGALPVITSTVVEHVPVGVVGIISPWNYPLTLTLSDAIPALLAGNGVVIKPDSQTPMSLLLAERLLLEAGLPEDLLQVVTGPGSVVGDAIARQCDYLMFTGSTATGRVLGAIAGERLIGYSAELGGKNPLIITEDANMASTIRGALNACFSNSGQLCISIERIYVHQARYQEFLEGFVAAVRKMRIGTGGWAEDMGSLISAKQVDAAMDFVNNAIDSGATLHCGGRLPDLGASFMAPVVLSGVSETADVHKQEVFGPVVYVEPYSNVEEVISRANATDYGLNASVFGKPATAKAIARRIMAGSVNINDGYAATFGSIDAPMGGMKASGLGRRHSSVGLLKYTEARTTSIQRLTPIQGPEELNREQYAKLVSKALKWGKHLL